MVQRRVKGIVWVEQWNSTMEVLRDRVIINLF